MAFLNGIKKRVSSVVSDMNEIADKKIKDISSVTEDVKKKVMEAASNVSETWENKEKYYADLKNWTADIPHTINKYADDFSMEDFWNKIKDSALKAGQDVVFMALVCYYAIEDKFKGKKGKKEETTK